jgi:hypothetical protein
MTQRLRETLIEASEQMPAARLSGEVWRRGRRARRLERLAGVAGAGLVLLLVAALVPAMVARPSGYGVGNGGDAVPAKLSLPWMWQASVQQSPPGAASVLFGGDTSGLHGTDIFDHEGKIAVLGRGGDYRMLFYAGVDTIMAGEDVQLSPDGTHVAQWFLADSGYDGFGMVITDLATGRSTLYAGTDGTGCCAPVAWAPDGRSLLTTQVAEDGGASRFVWLDLRTGTSHPLGKYHSGQVRSASRGAFSPDGQRVVLTEGTTVRLIDLSGQNSGPTPAPTPGQSVSPTFGKTLWTVDLGPRRYLAGIGAFTPDGTSIATVKLDGCLDECGEAALAARRWTFGYLDARTGAETAGPPLATVTGSAVRALGWRQGRDLVVLTYTPESGAHKTATGTWNDTGWTETGHVVLKALRPDGSTQTLLDPPDGVLTMDVARDLMEAGRFGGPSSSASIFPARSIIWIALVPLALLVLVAVVVLVAVIRLVRRHRRRVRPGPASGR